MGTPKDGVLSPMLFNIVMGNMNSLLQSQMCSFSLSNSKIFSTSTPSFQTFLLDITR
ncbi:hypothetical protein E2C01_055373 [Portunus trituberculatus]|uniref:Reverse transcriptase domain-containing protein n=1 Tax=Portunus trituberculatus TaxID=210409 RepID=A0A5B7GXJ5_PORTR|nr:hypothetical protein [Portunus trituberculatus]